MYGYIVRSKKFKLKKNKNLGELVVMAQGSPPTAFLSRNGLLIPQRLHFPVFRFAFLSRTACLEHSSTCFLFLYDHRSFTGRSCRCRASGAELLINLRSSVHCADFGDEAAIPIPARR
jgi:hypothetical protein